MPTDQMFRLLKRLYGKDKARQCCSCSPVPLASQVGILHRLKGLPFMSTAEACLAGRVDRCMHSEIYWEEPSLGPDFRSLAFLCAGLGLAFYGNGTVYRQEGLGWLLQHLSSTWGPLSVMSSVSVSLRGKVTTYPVHMARESPALSLVLLLSSIRGMPSCGDWKTYS